MIDDSDSTSRPNQSDATSRPGEREPCAVDSAETSTEDGRVAEVEIVDMHVTVEAFGSGVLLHTALEIPRSATVRDLRRIVMDSVAFSPRVRSLRLFVDHGGAELDDDEVLVAQSPMVTNHGKPLVVFPLMCTGCR